MGELAIICGLITSTVVAVLVAVFVVCCLINGTCEASWRRSEQATHRRMAGDLHTLARWMAYEFPIIEDATAYLLERLNESNSDSMSDFRDAMREKYGTKERQDA